MRKLSNRRLPSCPRDPSRRLHPLPPSTRPVLEQQLEETFFEPDSTEDVVESGQRVIQAEKRLESTAKDLEESYVDKSIEAAQESSDESEEEENVDSTDEEQLFADTDSDSGTGIMPPQLKFLSLKVFKATPEDDAFDWLERYEKLYLCSKLPTELRDLPIRPGVGLNAVDLPAVTGVRTLFLKEFQQQNYKLFQETRLRNRVQGIEEATTNYYYDVIDLYAVLGVAATRVADVPIDFIWTLPKPAPTAADTELGKVIKELQGPSGPQRGPLGPPAPINIVSQLAETTADSSTQDEIKEQPILRLDFSKLIREEVTCGTRQVMAVVDTGAALTVISPELPRASQFVMRPWDGPWVVMANG
ncbi:hypothetical protein OUZ56_003451 [Daphnia magna]|uniref:Peptidase A2 domain-containing protein n=1 Tax=Daphnia magna TaxID=35525 RepID=A0ABR0A8S2_9CRUS|nr:hypothetical protein OUZ56_003451 [Daphnia magna]